MATRRIVTDPNGQLKAFAYLTADKASVYRAIMRVFIEAKERFSIHLRPSEVRSALPELGGFDEGFSVDVELEALRGWGNLVAHPDTAVVTTVEDFYKNRYLYQLTPEGESAERAVQTYLEAIGQRGALQATALSDIRELLVELEQSISTDEIDEGKAHRALQSLSTRFDELTKRAQVFMGSLQRTIDLHGKDVEDFLKYKEALIEYLERFIQDLVNSTFDIQKALERIEAADVERLLNAVAERDLVDILTPTASDRRLILNSWRSRWQGLRSWFIGDFSNPSQAEVLRALARSSIPALLATVANINETRLARSDRRADLRTLALWFAQTDNDGDAHRLWRTAFGLTPARHLRIDSESIEAREIAPVSPHTSWLAAPPLKISPRLRQTGRHPGHRVVSAVIDRSLEKRRLAELAEHEAEQLAAARQRIAIDRQVRISDMGTLEPLEFSLFLDLLGEALSRKIDSGDVVQTSSSDGSLEIMLSPVPDAATATLVTTHGRFSGPDHFVTFRDIVNHSNASKTGAVTAASAVPARE